MVSFMCKFMIFFLSLVLLFDSVSCLSHKTYFPPKIVDTVYVFVAFYISLNGTLKLHHFPFTMFYPFFLHSRLSIIHTVFLTPCNREKKLISCLICSCLHGSFFSLHFLLDVSALATKINYIVHRI